MKGRIALALVVFVGSLLALLVFFGPFGGDQETQPEGASPVADGTDEAPRRLRGTDGEEAPISERGLQDDDVPPNPQEEAVGALAAARGAGWVRCRLPTGVNEISVSRRSSIANGYVSTEVQSPSGSIVVYPRQVDLEALEKAYQDGDVEVGDLMEDWDDLRSEERKPVGAFRWVGAEPGQRGRCETLPIPEKVAQVVRVLWGDGTPIEGASVGVGTIGPEKKTRADGRVTVQVWDGVATPVWAKFADLSRTFVSAVGGDVALVSIELERPEPEAESTDRIVANALEALDGGWDSLEQSFESDVAELKKALNTPGLSPDARDVLQGWLDEAEDRYEKAKEELRVFDEDFAEIEALLEQAKALQKDKAAEVD